MTGFAPQTAEVIDHGFGGSRGGAQITGAVIHHTTGQGGPGYVANANSRNSHPTYHVGVDGRVTGIVNPARRPYSTANGVDAMAITFEVDDEEIGGDWKISDAAMAAVAAVIAWHAAQSPRAGHPIEVNNPSATQAGFFVGWHQQYVNTACPGPFMIRHIPAIVAAANGGEPPVVTPPTAPPPAHTSNKLDVDGDLGPKTIARWQQVVGTPVDGVISTPHSALVARVQELLNARGQHGYNGKPLVVDGQGIASNSAHRVGKFQTIYALQTYLGTPADGYEDAHDSAVIRALQERLNTGTF